MYILSEENVKKIASRELAYEGVKQAFIAAYKNEGTVFPVVHAHGCDSKCTFSMKSGNLTQHDLSGLKMGSYWPDNYSKHGVPNHGTTTLLLDEKNGFPKAVINAGYLNGLRTAAANAVATDKLARKDAKILGILGAGHQALFEIKAVMGVRDIERILIHSRNPKTVAHAIEELAKDGIAAEAAEVETVCRNADVLTTVTGAKGALFDADWVKPGVHISAMGADFPGKQELPVELVLYHKCYADYPEQSRVNGEFEAGFNVNPELNIIPVGKALCGDDHGRISDAEITIFDSSGIALQDLMVAKMVLEEAIKQGIVTKVEF